jgi:hypothetical protein
VTLPKAAGLIVALATLCGVAQAAPLPPEHVDDFAGKPRAVVLSDIGNEPDDQMSLVRLLMYSNQLDLEALVATTSTWQREQLHPETLHELIAAYGAARPNLLLHAAGWPEAAVLDARVSTGPGAYGMAALNAGVSSPGAAAIIRAADQEDARPLWICVWGGANTLAQALTEVRATRGAEALARFVAKLRVYSISDQDDAGPWIRREFPDLFYIVKPSLPDGEEYAAATWTGISGDRYYGNGAGADERTVTNEWLDANIRAKGPLGKHYPKFAFIMEGDTPSFLGLIDNGLNAFRSPSWGGWGGRYVYRQPYGESHAIWSQGGDLFRRVTSADRVRGIDGQWHSSDQATIWRWREAYQQDFAARMDWTIKSFSGANHNPIVTVNAGAGTAPIYMDAVVGKPVTLDARATRDPDGDRLQFRWFHYDEAGLVPNQALAAVRLSKSGGPLITVTPTATCRPYWLPVVPCITGPGVAHIILMVTDAGSPALTSYRRVILRVQPR